MELREALTQIYEIREQVAQTEVFRGYRSATVAMTGVIAVITAGLQPLLVIDPQYQIGGYLILWTSAALVSVAITAMEMYWRSSRTKSPQAIVTTLLAVSQFLPALVAGGAVTIVLTSCAPVTLWMLPGLWAVFFSLGIFASYRLLPRSIFWVGAFYLIAGLMTLALAQGDAAFSPWAMGLPFGIGQFFAAAVLYWTLERNHGQV